MDLALKTIHGPVLLREVELLVLPGSFDELLIGRPEMSRLNLPDLESALAALAAEQHGRTDNMSGEQECGVSIGVHVETLSVKRCKVQTVIKGNQVAEAVMAEDDDFEEEAPLVRNGDPVDYAALNEEIERMLARAEGAGAPADFMAIIRNIVYDHHEVWRLELGADPPADVPPLEVTLLDPQVVPKTFRARPVSELQRNYLDDHITTLLSAGVIERSMSSFSSPIVLVRKPDLSWRMCVDLRYVNSLTRPMRFPLPRINELLTLLGGAKVFASFDLVKGFWQFPLHPESCKYFAFATHRGLYQFTRVVMGARNAATHFQAIMAQMLESRVRAGDTLVYLDDILSFARSPGELAVVIELVLQILERHGLKLQPRKCTLFAKEMVWCGHHISESGVSVNPEFVRSLLDIPVPGTAADLQQFLAAANWIRGRIPSYSSVVAPMQDILQHALAGRSKRTKRVAAGISLVDVGWGVAHVEAFESVRRAIVQAVRVAHPDPDKCFCLFTDASAKYWASVLTQIPETEVKLPVEEQSHEPLAFLSGVFRGAQVRWGIPDKEGFAIKESCTKLCHLLVREKGFVIFTDHRNLQYIFNPTGFASSVPKPTADRLERWAVLLRCYDYRIHHIEGERNVWADLLSRWGAPGNKMATCARVSFRVATDRVQTEEIVENFEGEDHPVEESWPEMTEILAAQRGMVQEAWTALGLRKVDGVLVAPEGPAVFIPAEPAHLRVRLLLVGHAGAAGHRGIQTTRAVLRDRFWWPTIASDVDGFIRQCLLCVKSRGGDMVPRPMGEQLRASVPREMIHFDYLKMAMDTDCVEYLLVIKDGFCGYTYLAPCKAADTEGAVEGLLHWFSWFGVADVWISDQGTHFRNTVMSALQRRLRVKHHFVTPGCAWANGSIERANREALRVYRTLLSEAQLPPERWRELTPVVQATLNATPSQERLGGHSPFEVMLGSPPRHPLDAVLGVDFGIDETEEEIELSAVAREHCAALSAALEAMVPDIEAGRARRHQQNMRGKEANKSPDFEIGDYVLELARGRRHKLQFKWLGPRRVVDTVNEYVFVVENLITLERTVAHASRLKRYADRDLLVTPDLRDQIIYDEKGLCVESLVGWRTTASGLQLRVRWLGFEPADATWEPLELLYLDIPEMIQNFAALRRGPRAGILREAVARLEDHEVGAE
jgi:hypothetical protein